MRTMLFTILTTVACSAAHAEGSRAPRKTLPSYDEVMRMAPATRIRYLHDLGKLLALIERQVEGRYDGVAVHELRERRTEVARWIQMLAIPEAAAADDVPEDLPPSNGPDPDTTFGVRPANRPTIGDEFDPRTGRLIRSVAKPGSTSKSRKLVPQATASNVSPGREAPPREATAAPIPPPTTTVAPAAAAPTPADAGSVAEELSFGQQLLGPFKKAEAAAQAKKAAAANGGAAGASSPPPAASAPASTVPPTTPSAVTGAPAPAATTRPWVEPTKPSSLPTFAQPPSKDFTPGPPGSLGGPHDDKKDIDRSCPWSAPKCDEKMSKQALQQLILDFRKSEVNKMCIAGGYFTEKKPGRKSGSCELKTSETFGPGKFECSDGRSVLCNPMLFCLSYPPMDMKVKVDGKVAQVQREVPYALCVPRGSKITEVCSERYDKILGGERLDLVTLRKDAKTNKVAKTFYDKLVKEKKQLQKCDINKVAEPGLKEKYTELQNQTQRQYEALCDIKKSAEGGEQFAKLFCKECGVIHKQLRATLANAGLACESSIPKGFDFPSRSNGTKSTQ